MSVTYVGTKGARGPAGDLRIFIDIMLSRFSPTIS
jgi:hypothetical protein